VSDPARLGPQLSPAERTLLARAREQRATDVVPEAVRERLLARARAEARRAPGGLPRAASLVPVGSRGAAQALAAAAAIAAGLVLLAHARGRGLPGGSLQPTAGEPADSSASEARPIGARLFQSELFRAPAAAYTGALPAPGLNLFGEAPFAPESRAWQARLWNDLGSAPVEPAAYEHEGSALCVRLGSGERIVAGWPWLPASEPGPRHAPSQPAEPPAIALKAGREYRLVFKAWAREPLPEQLLIAIGHARVPFSGAGGARVELSTTPQAFLVSIVPRYDDPSVGVAFLANAAQGSTPSRVCVSDVTLSLAGRR